MKIGIDARLVAYRQGGTSTYVRRLTEALTEIDAEDEFMLLQSRKAAGCMVAAKNAYCHPLWTPPHHFLEQWTLPLELARLPLDVLHSPDFIPPFRRRCPAVITVHDLSFRRFPETKTSESLRYYDQIDRAVVEAEAIIAVSEATRQDLQELLGVPRDRIEVVYHGVDRVFRPLEPDQTLRQFCERRGLPETFLLWVGTLEPRKNLACLFQALAAVSEDLPERMRTLVVVGDRGWEYEETEALFDRLGLRDRTIFYGLADEGELLNLYNTAWVLVFPSLYEGFGLPPLEAMACGTPVIASSVPALPEILGEAALYFDPHDPEALGQQLLRLAGDEALRAQLRSAGLARASSFSWHDTARRTLQVYKQAASR